jgi:hypothetical protein
MSALRRTLTVATRRGGLTVTYRPSDILLTDFDGAELDPHGAARRLIVSCVARWGIAGNAEGRYPITNAAVGKLPSWLVLDIALAITRDYRSLEAAAHEGMTAA